MTRIEHSFSVTEAIEHLSEIIGSIARGGLTATPVAVALDENAAPVAVVISSAQFAALAPAFDALVTGEHARQRLRAPSDPITLDPGQLADHLGVDLDERPPGGRSRPQE